jgi:hypothetical protein
MEIALILGALVIGALIVFKLVGNLIKIILLLALAAGLVLYFTGGDLSALNLPAIKL